MAPRSIGSFAWGYGQKDPALTLSTNNYTSYDVYNIPNVQAYTYTTLAENSDDAIRDMSINGDAQGFKIYPAATLQGRIGFSEIETDLGVYPAGTIIPVGLADTLKIINHRNRMLRDKNIDLQVPAATDNVTEWVNLSSAIAQAAETAETLGRLYFPAASYCHAYEPTVKEGEVLSPKFKAHKWFLPAPGDALRLSWFARQASVEDSKYDIYAKLILYGMCSDVPSYIPSTGETTLFNIAVVASLKWGVKTEANGLTEAYGRARPFTVYPMVQF